MKIGLVTLAKPCNNYYTIFLIKVLSIILTTNPKYYFLKVSKSKFN